MSVAAIRSVKSDIALAAEEPDAVREPESLGVPPHHAAVGFLADEDEHGRRVGLRHAPQRRRSPRDSSYRDG